MKIVHIGTNDGRMPFCLATKKAGYALLTTKLSKRTAYGDPCIAEDGFLALYEIVYTYCQQAYMEMYKTPSPYFRYRFVNMPVCSGSANIKCEDL